MAKFEAKFEVFSPRWGHTDPYRVEFTHEQMTIHNGNFPAVLKHVADGRDPEWSGYGGGMGNPLVRMMENDAIFPPTVVPRAVEFAWKYWREGEWDNEQALEALSQLFAWIDQTARTNPSGPWSGVF